MIIAVAGRCLVGYRAWSGRRGSRNAGAVHALAMEFGCAVCGVALLGMVAGSALGLVYEKVSGRWCGGGTADGANQCVSAKRA